jgi:hypothetical protein
MTLVGRRSCPRIDIACYVGHAEDMSILIHVNTPQDTALILRRPFCPLLSSRHSKQFTYFPHNILDWRKPEVQKKLRGRSVWLKTNWAICLGMSHSIYDWYTRNINKKLTCLIHQFLCISTTAIRSQAHKMSPFLVMSYIVRMRHTGK